MPVGSRRVRDPCALRRTPDPTYRQVCSHKTDHAEAVRLQYDRERIT